MASDKTQRVNVSAEEAALDTDDPGMFSVEVPQGEVWYLDQIGYERNPDGSEITPERVRFAIATDTRHDPSDAVTPTTLDDDAINSASPPSGAFQRNIGKYVYGGERIYLGIHNPTNSGQARIAIRGVVDGS